METIVRIGLDTSKSVFQLHGVDGTEQLVLRRKFELASWVRLPMNWLRTRASICVPCCSGLLLHRGNEMSRRLAAIPGVGPIGATLLSIKVVDARGFNRQETSLPGLA